MCLQPRVELVALEGCDRSTNTCTSCRGQAVGCGSSVACCAGACTNGRCPGCKGPGEDCFNGAGCCADSYCNGTKCFLRLRDGGIPP